MNVRARFAALAAAMAALGAHGDEARHSILESAGPQAQHIEGLWWLMIGVCTAVFILVMIALAAALLRGRDPSPEKEDVAPETSSRIAATVAGAIAVTVLILGVFLIASFTTDRNLRQIDNADGSITIKVTGHQWWWELQYEDPSPHRRFTSANEIHIPVGRSVHLKLATADVIHSLWIPNLHGKMDMIPGRENSLWIRADRPGVFEGQCAEFCGYQHAHMRLVVVAEPWEQFEAWRNHQLATARAPESAEQRRGHQVFMRTTCVMCHTIRGTLSGSNAGPDLTHFGSRRTLGAASLPNTRENLAAWIRDPQQIKPGTHMPPNAFPPDELNALVEYLEHLK